MLSKKFNLMLDLTYSDKGLNNRHSFSFTQDLHNFYVDSLLEITKTGDIKGLKEAINAMASIIKPLKASFEFWIIVDIDGQPCIATSIEFRLAPSIYRVRRKGADKVPTETHEYDLLKNGKEEVINILRKEAKKARELYKAAALEALAEKAKKAEAK